MSETPPREKFYFTLILTQVDDGPYLDVHTTSDLSVFTAEDHREMSDLLMALLNKRLNNPTPPRLVSSRRVQEDGYA